MPSSTTTFDAGSCSTSARSSTAGTPSISLVATLPPAMCMTASMVWVLPPPNAVCSWMTGSPVLPVSRLATEVSKAPMPSVMKVRWKNSTGSWYSGVAEPSWTRVMSAANSARTKVPRWTSSCGMATSRQGLNDIILSHVLTALQIGLEALQDQLLPCLDEGAKVRRLPEFRILRDQVPIEEARIVLELLGYPGFRQLPRLALEAILLGRQ